MGLFDLIHRLTAPDSEGWMTRSDPPTYALPTTVNALTHPFLTGADETGGGPGDSLSRPFEQSAWVQRAIKLVSEPIAAAPLRFSEQGRAAGEQLYKSAALEAFWQAPAVGPEGPVSMADFIAAAVGWLKLAGEAFFILDDEWLVPNGRRRPFIIARPDRMAEILDERTGLVLGWRFSDGRGRQFPLLAEQVVHPKFWNPFSEVRGCSEYSAARLAAEADHASARYARDLARNNGDRGPIISPRDAGQVISSEQREQITAVLRAKRLAALRGDFRPAFLTGAVTVEKAAPEATDAKFIAQRTENRKEIFAAFGVPPSMAESVATYSVGSASDRFRLIEDTCLPTSEKIAEHVEVISARFERRAPGKVLFAWWDFSDHSTMRQARGESVDNLVKLVRDVGMPPRIAGQFLGLGLPPFKGDDVSRGVPAATDPAIPAAKALPAPDPDPAPRPDVLPDALARVFSLPPPPDEPGDALGALLFAPEPPPVPAPEQRSADPDPVSPAEDAPNPARVARWRREIARRAPREKAALNAVKKVLLNARADVLRRLERQGKAGGGAVQRETNLPDPATSATAVMFDGSAFASDLGNAMEKAFRVAFQAAGVDVYAGLGRDDAWTAPAAEVTAAVATRANLVSGASEEMFDTIRAELVAGFEAGETTAQLADRVRGAFNDLTKGRAFTVAITETGAAYGAGAQSAMKGAGVKQKEWLSAHDSRVRPSHVAADGQRVGIDSRFTVGADHTPHPCAEGMSAAEAVNCRCVVVAVDEGDE